jgi:hypothetical protein
MEAAAKTVRVLSSATAGDKADVDKMTRAAKIPERRYIEALRACSRRAERCARKSGVG